MPGLDVDWRSKVTSDSPAWLLEGGAIKLLELRFVDGTWIERSRPLAGGLFGQNGNQRRIGSHRRQVVRTMCLGQKGFNESRQSSGSLRIIGRTHSCIGGEFAV